ncbi:hypothetical protein HZA45_00125 [Candidatus Peregrinibacteria bacterium]|nr:hypothetical protein [Candidatus Peregrinibacteria bacterium]
MSPSRPDAKTLIGKDTKDVPMSLQRIIAASSTVEPVWIGPKEAKKLSTEELEAYEAAHGIMAHLCVQAPTKHESGHPGGPLSSFTFAYFLSKRRDPAVDQPLRYSAGHLSLLAYGLQWLFGRGGKDARLAGPQAIIDSFRIPAGLPGHVEAGIGDIPFGTGPLGKGTSHALGAAFALKYLKKPGVVDIVLADGDSQEGQVMEAFRLAAHLQLDNLVVHGDWNDIQLSDMPSKTFATDLARIAAATGWQVIEVQNGNDPAQVSAALELADSFTKKGRPIFICYYTTMGYGVPLMEKGSNDGTANYHGSPIKKEVSADIVQSMTPLADLMKKYEKYRSAEAVRYAAKKPVETDFSLPWKADALKKAGYMRTVTAEKGAARKDFGETHLKNLMKADSRIVVLHADLAASGGFEKVGKEFPGRVINVGVAEANMYMMAAGMRQAGLLPVTYTFAAFGTNEARANARLIDINCSHIRCGVLHDCTHAGVTVGEDGETHQEQNYLNLPFRHTHVWMPGDSNQAAAMAEKAMEIIAEGYESVYVFSSRAGHPQVLTPKGDIVYGSDYVYDGKADIVRGKGDMTDKVTILATGITLPAAIRAADELVGGKHEDAASVRVLNVSSIRPLDAAAIIQAALETPHLIVVEDHNAEGGLATQVADVIADFQLPCSLRRLGLTHFFPSGTADDLLFLAGLDTDSIVNAVQDEMRMEVKGGEDAFVTCIYSFMEHLAGSRFREAAMPFLEKLREDDNYLDQLRAFWAARSIPIGKLPKNNDLKQQLGEVLKVDDLL